MKKIALILSVALFCHPVMAKDIKKTREYKEAYACAMESFTSGYGGGATAYCIGNGRDPSKVELKAYKDAEMTFKKKKIKR